MNARSLSLLFVCAVSACSSSSGSSPAGNTGEAGGSTTTLAPPPAGGGIQLKMETTIAGSSEDERCQFVQVTDDLWINSEQIRYTPGSHHFILWHTPYTSIPTTNTNGMQVDTSKVFQCLSGPFQDWKVDRFTGGAQTSDAPSVIGDLPGNVALHVPAGSVLIMDLHVLNASPNALDTTVLMNLNTIPKSAVTQEAGIYFFYDPFIVLPPGSPAHARMSCPVTSDVTLVNGQTHMHKQGLGGVANLEDSTGKVMQQLYESSVWTDPPVKAWSPSLALKAGQQIDYQCNYQNNGSTTIVQGPTASTNEMCVFFGAYYPLDMKFEDCSTAGTWDTLGSAARYIGTGTADGATTMQCLASAKPSTQDQGASLYGCIVNSCPAISKPLTTLIDCYQNSGANGQTACTSTVTALMSATCN